MEVNVTKATTVPGSGSDDTMRILTEMLVVLSKYGWMLPVIFGIPGNVITITVATRRHNRQSSSSIYMAAIAVADSILLIQVAWFFSMIYWNLGDNVRGDIRGFTFV
jgi:hypothetical protein